MRRVSGGLVVVGIVGLVIAFASGYANGTIVVLGGNAQPPSLAVLLSIPALIATGLGLIGLGRIGGPGLPGRLGLYSAGIGFLLIAVNSIAVGVMDVYAESSIIFVGLLGLLAVLVALPLMMVTLLRQPGRTRLVGLAFVIALVGVVLGFVTGYGLVPALLQLFLVVGLLGVGVLGLAAPAQRPSET